MRFKSAPFLVSCGLWDCCKQAKRKHAFSLVDWDIGRFDVIPLVFLHNLLLVGLPFALVRDSETGIIEGLWRTSKQHLMGENVCDQAYRVGGFWYLRLKQKGLCLTAHTKVNPDCVSVASG